MNHEKSFIDDCRVMSEFKGVTFSGFKASSVMQRLFCDMINEKIESACYWCAELVCSGHYVELWETIIQFYCKYVHISNPKLSIYLASKLKRFRENMNNAETEQEQLDFRNDPGFRELFVELVVILCTSAKKYIVHEVKVSAEDFNMLSLKNLLHAPDLSSCEKILKDEDPKELIISINEFSYNLTSKVANTIRAYYWYEWIIEYGKICKKARQPCRIVKRDDIEIVLIDEKFATNPVWLIWVVLKEHATKRGKMYERIIDSLFEIFCLRYNETCNTKRRLVVYFAVSILTTNIVFNDYEIVKDKRLLSCVLSQSYLIFSQVKENGNQIQRENIKNHELEMKEKAMQDGGIENRHVMLANEQSNDAMFGMYDTNKVTSNKLIIKGKATATSTATPVKQKRKSTRKGVANVTTDDTKNISSKGDELFGTDFIPLLK